MKLPHPLGRHPRPRLLFSLMALLAACGDPSPGTTVDGGSEPQNNTPPALGALAAVTVAEGQSATVTLSATDPEGDPVSFSLGQGAPSWAVLSGSTLSLSPGFEASGDYTLTVGASDGKEGGRASGTFAVKVTNVNRPPVLTTLEPVVLDEAQTQAIPLVATDPDGEQVTFSLGTGAPSWASISASVLTLAPRVGNAGATSLTVLATDPGGLSDSKSFTVTVKVLNTAPTLSGLAQLDASSSPVAPGSTVAASPSLRATVDDPQNDSVKLDVEVVTAAGAFSGTPTHSSTLSPEGALSVSLGTLPAGSYKWQARAVDASGLSSSWTPFNGEAAAFVIAAQQLNGSVSINSGAAATNSSAVTLTLSVTPSAGATLSQMAFSNDGTTFTAFETYASTRSWTLSSGDGSKLVYARVRDSNSNESTFSDIIVLDTSKPVISSFGVKNGVVATNTPVVTLDFIASDTGTGVKTVEASNDGTTFSAVSATSPASWTLAGADGTKTVTLRVTDEAGNVTTASDTLLLDTSAPTLSAFSLNAGAGYTHQLTVTGDSTADGSGSSVTEICVSFGGPSTCQPYAPSVSLTLPAGDGTKTAIALVKDAAGNQSGFISDTIVLDTVAPSLSSISINAGAAHTTSAAVTLTATASDAIGLAEIAFSTDGGNTYGAYQAYEVSGNAFTLPTGDGSRTVHAKVRDLAGNESSAVSDSIVLDTAGPTGTLTLASGAAATNTPTLTLTLSASDATSGVSHHCVREDSTTPGAADSCWTPYTTGPVSFTLSSGDGAKTVYAWFKDAAGLVGAPATDGLILDTTAPSLTSFKLNGGATYANSSAVTADNVAGDGAGSGLSQVCTGEVSPPTNCQAYSASAALTLSSGDGSKTVYLKVTDVAGNSSTISNDTLLLDTTRPTLSSISLNSGAAHTATTSVTISAVTSDASGVAEIAFSDDGGASYGAFVAYVVSGNSHTLPSGDGTRTVHAKVRDVAGNESTGLVSDSILLDTTPPTGTISIQGGAAYTNTSTVTLTLNGGDGTGSGVLQHCVKNGTATAPAAPISADACWTAYSTSVSNWGLTAGTGTRYVYVWFKDQAGLISQVAGSDSIIFDDVVPTAPTGLNISAGHRELLVSWTASTDSGGSGLRGYEVGVGTTSGSYTWQPLVTGTSAVLTGLGNGRTYYVAVRATDNAGNGTTSAESTGKPRFPFNPNHRTPTAASLYRTHLYATSEGIAVGEAGAVFTTADGWTTSTRRDPLHDLDIRGLYVNPVNTTTILVGGGGNISVSTDRGATWSLATNNQSAPQSDLFDITQVDSSSNPLGRVTRSYVAVGDGGTILRGSYVVGFTTLSMSTLTSPSSANLASVARCAGTSCNTVVAVGASGTILHSTDKGLTWTQLTTPTGYTNATFRKVLAVPGTNQFYIGGKPPSSGHSALLKSTDGGLTWSQVPGFEGYSVYDLDALDATHVGAAGTSLSYLTIGGKTYALEGGTPELVLTDGSTLFPQTLPSTMTRKLLGFDAVSLDAIAFSGEAGEIGYTSDGGTTWADKSSGRIIQLNAVALSGTNNYTGWVVGNSGYIAFGTLNGTLSVHTSPGTDALYGVAAPSNALAFAVGGLGSIYKYNGTSWAKDPDTGIVTGALLDVACPSTTNCFAVGADKAVLQFNGTGWVTRNISSGAGTYNSIDTYTAGGTSRAIVVGTAGAVRILNGTTWTEPAAISGSPTLYGVGANRTGNGVAFAVGAGGALYKSTDHGASWTAGSSGVTTELRAVAHGGGTTWYAAGAGGVVLKSTDDGATWYPLATSVNVATFRGLAVGNTLTNYVHVVGDLGTLATSSTAGE